MEALLRFAHVPKNLEQAREKLDDLVGTDGGNRIRRNGVLELAMALAMAEFYRRNQGKETPADAPPVPRFRDLLPETRAVWRTFIINLCKAYGDAICGGRGKDIAEVAENIWEDRERVVIPAHVPREARRQKPAQGKRRRMFFKRMRSRLGVKGEEAPKEDTERRSITDIGKKHPLREVGETVDAIVERAGGRHEQAGVPEADFEAINKRLRKIYEKNKKRREAATAHENPESGEKGSDTEEDIGSDDSEMSGDDEDDLDDFIVD